MRYKLHPPPSLSIPIPILTTPCRIHKSLQGSLDLLGHAWTMAHEPVRIRSYSCRPNVRRALILYGLVDAIH